MLLEFFNWMAEVNPDFNVFAYITLRGILGALTALAISLILGPSFIRRLVKKQVRQPIRVDTRNRDVCTYSIDDDRHEQKTQTSPELG